MRANPAAPSQGFWEAISEHVTAKVQPMLRQGQGEREPVIAYLRDLEALARRESGSREAIQIISSGRRVLGDRRSIVVERGCRTSLDLCS